MSPCPATVNYSLWRVEGLWPQGRPWPKRKMLEGGRDYPAWGEVLRGSDGVGDVHTEGGCSMFQRMSRPQGESTCHMPWCPRAKSGAPALLRSGCCQAGPSSLGPPQVGPLQDLGDLKRIPHHYCYCRPCLAAGEKRPGRRCPQADLREAGPTAGAECLSRCESTRRALPRPS